MKLSIKLIGLGIMSLGKNTIKNIIMNRERIKTFITARAGT